jgi:hypothetical protein
LDNGRFDRLSAFYTSECAEPAPVYETYESALMSELAAVRVVSPDFSAGIKPAARVAVRRWAQNYAPRAVKDFVHRFIRY